MSIGVVVVDAVLFEFVVGADSFVDVVVVDLVVVMLLFR